MTGSVPTLRARVSASTVPRGLRDFRLGYLARPENLRCEGRTLGETSPRISAATSSTSCATCCSPRTCAQPGHAGAPHRRDPPVLPHPSR